MRAGEPVGYENLLVRDNATGAYQLVNAPPPGVTPADAHFEGASADLSHVVFSELAPLTPGAPCTGVENLYEWDEGALRLLTVLPDGTPAQGSLAEASNRQPGDLRRRVRTSCSPPVAACTCVSTGRSTVQVDASQIGGAGGGGSFQAMSADGSTVLFTDENQLTPGSTAEAGKPDLYECVLPEGASRCELSDLTVAGGGRTRGRAERLAARQPGQLARLLRREGRAGKQHAGIHEQRRQHRSGKRGTGPGQPVRVGWRQDDVHRDAQQQGGDSGVGAVSPDGTWFAFDSIKSLTGYDNIAAGRRSRVESSSCTARI